MKRIVTQIALLMLTAVVGCGGIPPVDFGSAVPGQPVPGQTSLSSPLHRGVYTGTIDCEITTIDAGGRITTQDIPLSVTFEITDEGVPIVGGREIEVGRTVDIGNLRATYIRIEPTSNGIVWHFDSSGSTGDVTFEGVATSELRSTNTNALEYRFTQTAVDTAGNALSQVCIGPLFP